MISTLLVAVLAAAPVKVADRVWVIRHPAAPDGFPQGNTTVIAGERATLVVDSAYLPSAARADLSEIRKLTDHPIRYLVNTHWHPDHTRGNAVYASEVPGLAIVAHRQTLELLRRYEPPNLARYRATLARMRAHPVAGEKDTLAGMERVWAELEGYSLHFPDILLDQVLDLDLGGREVRVQHLGRGHTLGDVAVIVADAGVLATGDALVLPIPFFYNGYPAEFRETLEAMKRLGAQVIIPGHGDVQRDNRAIERVAALIASVVSQVNSQVAERGSISAKLEDVRKLVDVKTFRLQFASSPAQGEEFDRAVGNLIRLAFEQAPK